MIGMARKDAGRAIELFHQHRAGKQMGPSRRPESEQEVGICPLGLTVSVRCPKYEASFAHAVVAPAFERCGEFLRRDRLAALVEQDSLVWGKRFRDLAAGFGKFGQFDRPCQPLLITRDKFGFRRTSDLSAGYDVEEDGECLSVQCLWLKGNCLLA